MPTVLAHFFAKSITPLLLALPSKSGKKNTQNLILTLSNQKFYLIPNNLPF